MQVSIIIPALDEASTIAQAVERARPLKPAEIIVVDGGSRDDTVARAAAADRVIVAPRGRAAQQNAGAAASRGDVLLFLHADCWLAPGSLSAVALALADDRVVGGCFQQRIEADGLWFRWLERGNALRVRWWRLAYGDQGIFVRRSVFERLGGFPPLALMEDLFFMKRLRKEGQFVLLDARLHVSPRRWLEQGVVRQTLRNWLLTALCKRGFLRIGWRGCTRTCDEHGGIHFVTPELRLIPLGFWPENIYKEMIMRLRRSVPRHSW